MPGRSWLYVNVLREDSSLSPNPGPPPVTHDERLARLPFTRPFGTLFASDSKSFKLPSNAEILLRSRWVVAASVFSLGCPYRKLGVFPIVAPCNSIPGNGENVPPDGVA